MKKILVFGLAIVLFASCNQKQRYTQNSPEIDTFKSNIKSYNDQDWEGMKAHYADTAKTYNNSSDIGLSFDEMVDFHKQSLSNLSNRGFLDKDQEYEMVVTDKGDTWVNFWGDWEGTLKANGKKIKIPIHLTGQFKDGKIVRTSGNWDNAPMVLALQEIEAAKNSPEIENKIRKNNEMMFKSWNTYNPELMKTVTIKNVLRYSNGTLASKNQEGFEAMMRYFQTASPDLQFTWEDMAVQDGKSYTKWTAKGTNTGKFGENPATGKKSTVHGFTIFSYDSNGQIVQEETFMDNLGYLEEWGYTIAPPQ